MKQILLLLVILLALGGCGQVSEESNAGYRQITAEEAKLLRSTGRRPSPGAVLTPLAKEIMEGSG